MTELATESALAARNRILRAARDEFASRGLDASSVRAIAARAGVTAAMINYYFGGKRALYDALVEAAQAQLHARLREAVGEGGPALPERLAGAYFDFLAEEGPTQRLLLREILDDDSRASDLIRPLRAMLRSHYGADEGALQLAISLFGAIAGYFIYAPVLGELLGRDPLSPKALAHRRAHVVGLARLVEGAQR